MVVKYHEPDQKAMDTAVRAKNDSPTKIKAALAQASKSSSESTLSFHQASMNSDYSNNSISSHNAAGNIGMMTQRFDVEDGRTPNLPASISLS